MIHIMPSVLEVTVQSNDCTNQTVKTKLLYYPLKIKNNRITQPEKDVKHENGFINKHNKLW